MQTCYAAATKGQAFGGREDGLRFGQLAMECGRGMLSNAIAMSQGPWHWSAGRAKLGAPNRSVGGFGRERFLVCEMREMAQKQL